ncbi:MAG: ABC transporter substrate-binding protein [Rubrivivax sp.]|nr:ABC transporter substrate-binding protein [Rubrivivax sp.]
MLGAAAPLQAQGPGTLQIKDDRGRLVPLAQPPQRVVSLLPSLSETVCALRACDRLVGVDRFSNWPVSLRRLPQLGGLEDTQIERLVALKPDLVLLASASRAIDRLEALGLKVVVLEPRNLHDTERVILAVAQALGDASAGPALWQALQARTAAAVARVPPALRGKTVYFEVASAPYAAGEASFIGENLARLGMGNVVPAALGPFPKLNPEFVVRAQPDLIMATAGAVAEMPSRPGWARLRALREKRHCGFAPDRWDVLVRPGPRVAEAAEILADCLVHLADPAARSPFATGATP